MNYDLDINIDEDALDVEWLEQPSLMYKYAKKAASARKDRDAMKEKLDVVKAEMDKDIRSNPEKYDISKITEGVVQNTILMTPEYQNANDEYLDARYETELIQAALNAIEARKSALENLVRLHGLNYFAGPTLPRNLTEEREMKQKKADTGIANRMKRKRKV